jgi:hypothetical protein
VDEVTILLTLYSIVAGLGISRLVQGVGSMIEARNRISFDWLHTAWLLIVFMAHVVSWFALMRFAKGAHWTVFNAIGALCMPIVLYLISDLVIPRIGDQERIDLRKYYRENHRWFAGLMIAFVLLGILVQIAVERRADWSEGGVLRGVALLVLAVGFASPRPVVQAFQAVVLLAIAVAGAALVSIRMM